MAVTDRVSILCRLLSAGTFAAPWEGGANGRIEVAREYLPGTTTGCADAVGMWQGTIALGATQVHDLAAGSTIAEADGTYPTFVKVKALAVQKVSGTGTLRLVMPANGVPFMMAATDGTAPLANADDAVIMLFGDSGITVTAGTGDLIHMIEAGGAAAVVAKIIVIGTTA